MQDTSTVDVEIVLLEDFVPEARLTLPVLGERVNNHIKFFWAVAAIFGVWLGGISVVLYQMNASISALKLPQKLEQSSLNPQDRSSQEQAASILAQAQANPTKIPESVIERAGARFIEASARTPEAWGTALHFMDYRSSINGYLRVVKTVNVLAGAAFNFDLGPTVNEKSLPRLSFIEAGVAIVDGARFETIGKNLNEQLQIGIPEVIAKGGTVSLDNKYLRHVALEGVEIHYSGKAVILEDVVFINCNFVMDNTEPSRKLGQTLLASSIVEFRGPA